MVPNQKLNRLRPWMTGVLLLFAALLGTVTLLTTAKANQHAVKTSPQLADKNGSPMPVTVHPASDRPFGKICSCPDTCFQPEKSPYFAPLSGEIRQLNMRVGQQVQQGDVLLETDSTAYESALKLSRSRMKLETLETGQFTGRVRPASGHALQFPESSPKLESAAESLAASELALADAQKDAEDAATKIAQSTLTAPFNGIITDCIPEGTNRTSSIAKSPKSSRPTACIWFVKSPNTTYPTCLPDKP